jgi:hypothetical protein
MVQIVLADPKWRKKLTDADRRALSALLSHLNLYGTCCPAAGLPQIDYVGFWLTAMTGKQRRPGRTLSDGTNDRPMAP